MIQLAAADGFFRGYPVDVEPAPAVTDETAAPSPVKGAISPEWFTDPMKMLCGTWLLTTVTSRKRETTVEFAKDGRYYPAPGSVYTFQPLESDESTQTLVLLKFHGKRRIATERLSVVSNDRLEGTLDSGYPEVLYRLWYVRKT